MSRLPRPPALSTFAIGSLPHTQLELALQVAFQLDIPTLPQLPRTGAAEFMLPQALDGLPGVVWDTDGRTTIVRDQWERSSRRFNQQLDSALKGHGLAAFEPGPTSCRAWKPFLWEVENRKSPFAKAQIAGPVTTLWATTLSDGTPAADVLEVSSQIHRLVLARSLAMTAALKATGTTPIIFLDEPGLFAFDGSRPTHAIELRQLGVVAATLKRAGALVGVHCCGNTNWGEVAKLDLDFISADARLSLASILDAAPAFDEYLARGGWLGLGIVPTSMVTREPITDQVAAALTVLGDKRASVLARTMLSPACGLALRTVADSERILEEVREAQALLR